MKKRISILILAFIMLISCMSICAVASDFTVDARFSFENDDAFLQIFGTTPAKYRQRLMIAVYDPAFDDEFSLDNLKNDETGELYSEPSELRPITDYGKVLRLVEIAAGRNGYFETSIPISDGVQDGQYMIIKIEGSGKTPVAGSLIRYYETEESINEVTLPAFENATADELDDLFYDKQLLLGISLDESYTSNKEKFNRLFVAVRNEDSPEFNTLNDVLAVWDSTMAIMSLPEAPGKADIDKFINDYSALIDYDFSENNAHYTTRKDEIHKLIAGIFKANTPTSMNKVKTVITQATGLALFNSKDTTTVTPIVESYASVFGIDLEDYEIYCDKYTSYEVNKAFVGKNFTQPEQVAQSLKERVKTLENKNNSSSGSGGGGGGGASSSSGRDWIVKDTENPKTDVEVPVPTVPEVNTDTEKKFNDVTIEHWAYASIVYLSEKGIVNGFEDGSFRPDEEVTREQFVKMLVGAFELKGESVLEFNDVTDNRWSAPFISTAKANGIVNGITEYEFSPETVVTRQDAAVMLYRICAIKKITMTETVNLTDSDSIAAYASESVSKLAGAGVIGGFEDGSFRPMNSLTRAQAVKLIYGLMNR